MLCHLITKSKIDIDELVYDKISDFDWHFVNDPEWFDEEETDIKDSLRDQVLEMLGLEDF